MTVWDDLSKLTPFEWLGLILGTGMMLALGYGLLVATLVMWGEG